MEPDAQPDELRTPEEWEKDPRVTRIIVNRDGWYYSPPSGLKAKQWEEPITFDEFQRRAYVSTSRPR